MDKTKVDFPDRLTAASRIGSSYKTVGESMPIIVVKAIDFFCRQKRDLKKFLPSIESPEEAEAEAKALITELSILRKDIETNKQTTPIEKITDLPSELEYLNDDVDDWNSYMEANKFTSHGKTHPPFFLESPALMIEFYIFRKMKQMFLKTKHLKMLDPFFEQKIKLAFSHLYQMIQVGDYLTKVEKEFSDTYHPSERLQFDIFLHMDLWANSCDLVSYGGSADKFKAMKLRRDLSETVDSLKKNILCDKTVELWAKIEDMRKKVDQAIKEDKTIYIDLVSDNAGFELFMDMCLFDLLSMFLCGSKKRDGVRFRLHIKRLPSFVSDTLSRDIWWLLDYMEQNRSPLPALARKWKDNFNNKIWEIKEHKFWTLPHDYSEMKSVSLDLFDLLKESSLIIFKGDHNYRKVVGDRDWHLMTPLRNTLLGFHPAPMALIRTIQASTVVGIEDTSIFSKINNNEYPSDWQTSGKYALIQFVCPQV